MRIDREIPICGVRPVMLKNLFRRERFDTVTAMAELGLVEPLASETLFALERNGWIEHRERSDFVDRWETTAQAQRLRATRLIKRFPIMEGRQIVERIADEARVINQNPDSTCRIAEIILFGSVLTGADDGDAGDIDLIVEVQRRKLDPAERERLADIEEAAMPESLGFFQRLHRTEYQILRRLKKVSNKIALHRRSDLSALGAPHRSVYAYSVAKERELPVDTAIRILEKDEADKKASSPKQLLPSLLTFDWPAAPNAPCELDYVDVSELLLAQHMWANAAPVADIAGATQISEEALTGYLASRRAVRPRLEPIFHPDLKAMLGQALEPARRHVISTRITVRSAKDLCIGTDISEGDSYERLANIRRFSPSSQIYKGRCDLMPVIEPVNAAAWAWYQRMKPRLRGVGLDIFMSHFPDDDASVPVEGRPIDFRPFPAPMLDLLRTLLPNPRPRYSEYDHSLEISLGGSVSIVHRLGREGSPGSTIRRVKKSQAPDLWEMVRDFNGRYEEILST